MSILRRLLPFLLLFLPISALHADEIRPGYLEWTQVRQDAWQVTWKTPLASRLSRDAILVVPENCSERGDERETFTDRARTVVYDFDCSGGLTGRTLGIEGLSYDDTDAIVRISPLGEEVITTQLTAATPVVTLSAEERVGSVAGTYFILGAEHILEGYDHLLFVIALVLLLRAERRGAIGRIAGAVTAFTVAHSITLAASTLGHMSLPGWPVEVTIALSIIFLAAEIVKSDSGREARLSERIPWAVAFLFGLLHGFGFAGALAEIGLPQNDVPMALLTFNLGVEAGQLLIVAIAVMLLKTLYKFGKNRYDFARKIFAYGIGITACFWFTQRLFQL